MIDIDKFMENYKEEERVRCPHCQYDLSEDSDYTMMYEQGIPISYLGWPDEEDKIVECPECQNEFKVREHVRRTYDTRKLNEEF